MSPFLLALIALQAAPRGAGTPVLVPLEVPPLPPEHVTLASPLGSLELVRHSLRAPQAFVRVAGDGNSVDEAPPPPRTYRGNLVDAPESAVVASLDLDGWRAWIERRAPDGSTQAFELEPAGPLGWHRLSTADEEPFACGVADAAAPLPPSLLTLGTREDRRRCLERAEIAFDADLEYYQLKGSSVANTVAAIDAIMNQVDFFYARDVQITFTLTAYVVRTTAFYQPTSGGDLLDDFRTEWTTNQAAIPRDLAHLMTAQPGSLIQYGGLAYVGVVCSTSIHYGWSMDGANIVGHEVGHNFGAGHCHDVEPCNNMCGACFYVGPETRKIISAFRDASGCLDPAGDRPPQVAPYAMPDRAAQRKDRLAEGLALEVLFNDDDGDCQPFLLAGADAVSARGGTIVPANAPGGARRERLLYRGPSEAFVGEDSFQYVVADAWRASSGTVTLESTPLELLGYWPLDELAGTLASDASRGGRAGTLAGGPSWDTGQFAGALYFDGNNDRVNLPALDAHTNRLTITAWVKRQGAQDDFAGLVFSRAGSTVAGLALKSNGALRYTWNDDPATYQFSPSLFVPDGQWAFVALVVEPEQATLYLKTTALSAWVNPLRHAREAFDGRTVIGRDDLGFRQFQGWIDDVRIYGYALGADEIAWLADASGPADSPLPRDGQSVADPAVLLDWLSGLDASAHDLYLGTSYGAVRAATPTSGEFQGTLTGTSFTPPSLVAGTRYFWRVDEQTPGGIVPGHVWEFEPARFHRWPLDETSGTNADEPVGGLDGTYQNGVTLNQAGATPSLGRAVSFDGTNDRVQIPALHLDSNRVTLSCWLRRNGAQNSWAGLAFSRAGSTVAGLHFGTAQELRYTWNDDGGSWGWDSGLIVPDATWVFAALVIEPTQATLHLGQSGTLTSATNPISHSAEAFDSTLWLGRDPHSSPRHYRGLLDDVRAYDHALTPAEVEALYQDSL
jgi:hypothetical protein